MAKGKKAPAPKLDTAAPKRLKLDGWANAATGVGVLGKDKRLSVSYSPDLLDPLTCEALWRGNDLAARIIEVIPDEALREGVEFKTDDNDFDELIEDELLRLNAIEVLREAWQTARAMGGAGILIGATDGSSNLELPLAEDRIRTIDYLTVLTPRELWAERWQADPTKPAYGEVVTYRLVPIGVPPGASVQTYPIIHASRIIRISGVRTTRRYRYAGVQPGWDDSLLGRVVESLSDFQGAFSGAGILAADFSFAVLKLKGLAQILATEQGQSLSARAAGIEAARSIANVTLLDSEEEYERQTTNIAGLPDLLEKLMLRLSAAAKIPVALLMGQGPTGLNATGDADVRWFYDQIKAEQRRIARPALKRLFELLLSATKGPARGKPPEKWEFEFRPLWQMTEKEEAEIRSLQATVDVAYITAQVVTPTEIAKSRFGGETYSTDTQIDIDLRDEMLGDDELQASHLGAAPDGGPAVDPLEAAKAAAMQVKVDPKEPNGAPQ